MRASTRALLLVSAAAILVAGVGAAIAVSNSASDGDTASAPGPAVILNLPGLTPAAGEPQLASVTQARPEPGTAVLAAGPFDDRFEVEELTFVGGAVTGTIHITSDVSEVLELQVIAGFYDANGEYLGTGSFVLPETEEGEAHAHAGAPEQHHAFVVAVPENLVDRAVSAAIGVPILVNE